MTAALAVGVLTAGGVFLVLRPGLVRITFGFVLLGHAVNILLLTAGGTDRRNPPLLGHGDTAEMADPLPQAFVLTAIVITFGITVLLLGMARAHADWAGAARTDRADGEQAGRHRGERQRPRPRRADTESPGSPDRPNGGGRGGEPHPREEGDS
ncbi:NADH-quinone oxidoreductase subunit K [Streptomyces sp. OF3]|uniref:Cation:proton antiporter n=1 Tax=Streptomyces alkaliterrae TaxID=2213162 RepID=A0A5P0YQ14_9ACTN|nr:NADH-quinone oxidoreductase subunit K [Streptomyces alkaliterrae]MBB1259031.1 NADH-quinone oxidoreductase subunit K [Streptomyces alkaliterrae]MQS02454.1 cation:proton antiporter [Streptomyces alkaliterrae]